MKERVILCVFCLIAIFSSFVQCEVPEVAEDVCENQGVWSKLLEDYTLNLPKGREARVWGQPRDNMIYPRPHQNTPHPPQHQSHFGAPFHITKRVGEVMELEPHMRPPASKLINNNNNNNNIPFRQNFVQNGPGGSVQHPAHLREVSETDLYLLGAIEKLVYRVDYMEARLRRSEQIIYYLMAGNNQKEVRDPCRTNFTRIGDNCYHINSAELVNWKTANTACRNMGAFLAEFEKASENEEVMAFLLNHQEHKAKDFWLGGLNPGLLWIWANSAKPVNPNTNLESFVNSTQAAETADSSENDVNKLDEEDDRTKDDKILNNTVEIKGRGRCLRLTYNTAKQAYYYYGQECTSRHYFMCEYEDKSVDNKIKKITRDLKLDV